VPRRSIARADEVIEWGADRSKSPLIVTGLIGGVGGWHFPRLDPFGQFVVAIPSASNRALLSGNRDWNASARSIAARFGIPPALETCAVSDIAPTQKRSPASGSATLMIGSRRCNSVPQMWRNGGHSESFGSSAQAAANPAFVSR
jgi:hypothetical protein